MLFGTVAKEVMRIAFEQKILNLTKLRNCIKAFTEKNNNNKAKKGKAPNNITIVILPRQCENRFNNRTIVGLVPSTITFTIVRI